MSPIFYQKFSKGWLILLLPILFLTVYGALTQGENTMKLLTFSFLILSIIILLYSITLQIKIEANAISYKWSPFQRNFTSLNKTDIKSTQIIRYPFIGYGFRVSKKYGLVHNTSGAIGIQVEMNNGEKILIGITEVTRTKELLKENGYEI